MSDLNKALHDFDTAKDRFDRAMWEALVAVEEAIRRLNEMQGKPEEERHVN